MIIGVDVSDIKWKCVLFSIFQAMKMFFTWFDSPPTSECFISDSLYRIVTLATNKQLAHFVVNFIPPKKKSISSVSSLRHTGIKNRIALGVALCTHRIKDCEMSFCRHWLCVGQHSMSFERMKTQWEIKWFDAQKPASSLKHRSGKWCEST